MELKLDRVLKLGRSQKILILAGIHLLLVALYGWLFFYPLQQDLQALDQRLSGLLGKKAEQEAVVRNLPAFRQECRNLEAAFQKAMAQLPNKKEIPSLLQNISNLGRESGLEMPFFKPGNEVKKDFYAEVPVDIKVVGSFQNMLRFFFQVGALPRIVTIGDLSIQQPQKADSPTQLEAACKAVTYKFLEESERTPPDRKAGKPAKKGAPGPLEE